MLIPKLGGDWSRVAGAPRRSPRHPYIFNQSGRGDALFLFPPQASALASAYDAETDRLI